MTHRVSTGTLDSLIHSLTHSLLTHAKSVDGSKTICLPETKPTSDSSDSTRIYALALCSGVFTAFIVHEYSVINNT